MTCDWLINRSLARETRMDGVAKAVLSLSWYSYVLLTLALLAAYLWYRWVHVWWPFEQLTTCTGSCRVAYMPYSVFKKLGIPGPTPRAFFGSAADLADVHVSSIQLFHYSYLKIWLLPVHLHDGCVKSTSTGTLVRVPVTHKMEHCLYKP